MKNRISEIVGEAPLVDVRLPLEDDIENEDAALDALFRMNEEDSSARIVYSERGTDRVYTLDEIERFLRENEE